MEDEDIVSLYWERKEAAIAETEGKYGRYLKKIALNILAIREDAEECVNDAYLGAWNAIPPNRPNPLRIFLARIVRNIALDRVDYNRRKKRNRDHDVLLSELEECLPDLHTEPEQKLQEEELISLINCFLGKLADEKRKIFICRYWYFDSIKDIAAHFSMSEGKVKTALFRTRNLLKEYLQKEGCDI